VAFDKTAYQREYMAKRRAAAKQPQAPQPADEIASLKARITKEALERAALEQELTAAKAHSAELARDRIPSDLSEVAVLKREVAELKATLASERKQRKPEKPPLPPDEVRDRRIKALQTQLQNLKREWAKHADAMSFQTMSTIMKALSPDQRRHWDRAELDAALDAACRVFTAWKAAKDKAQAARR
jgi:predicted  nucleic acid-binding Zn-ribbon protein